MKIPRLAAFLTVFFLVYFLINYYIYSGGMTALQKFAPHWLENAYGIVFLFLMFSFPLARIFGKWLPIMIADFFSFTGGMWFAAMLYFTLSIVLIDFAGLIAGFNATIQTMITGNQSLINGTLFLMVVFLVVLIIAIGYINALSPRIKFIQIQVDKNVPDIKNLHLAFASDIHLGHIIGRKSLKKILGHINALNPDLVLFPGDLVDEELTPVINKNLGELFKTLTPKYGVYAVPGNHEYIGGVEQAIQYLSKFGIRFLRDSVVDINGLFYIAGRDDISITNFYGISRKPLKELLADINPELPLIMMDHQPIALMEAADHGVDLQISGHTHHGQMWPLQAITKRVFKLSRGYRKINGSHFYVSSGAGTWGPRVRIGSHPEIVSVRIIFRDKPKVSQNEQL
jgi:uncharacterized protein